VTEPQGTGGVDFATAPLQEDLVIVGEPRMRLVSSSTAPRVHLIANLYDESPGGDRRRISQFAINPELRHGLATPQAAMLGQRYVLDPPGFTMGHHLRAGRSSRARRRPRSRARPRRPRPERACDRRG
jgi:uncharacterized protein